MSSFNKRLIFITLFFFKISICLGASNTVFIDIDYILNNSNLGKKIYYELDIINKENINIIKKKEEILNKKQEEINSKKNILSKEEIEKEYFLLNEEYNNYKVEKDKLLKKFREKKEKELDKFLTKVKPIIQDYMKENSIDIILDQNQIFIGVSKNNITDIILKLVNNKFPQNG
tara:strand:- start:1026 stop:1547 length:522 start_codon:yes stop_codon:yes gene_type:complete